MCRVSTAALLLGCIHHGEVWNGQSPERPRDEISRIWLAYLQSKHGLYSSGAFVASPYWSTAEQRQWHVYDLAGFYLPDNAAYRVENIRQERGLDDVYRVTTQFEADDDQNAMRSRRVIETVFAQRQGDHWVILNALPRLTRTWRRDTVGAITYVTQPGYRFQRARAERAAAFVDSLADALGIARPSPITYYVATSIDEIDRIIGLETPIKWGPVGGLAMPTNRLLFSGIPAVGEEYRHELAHMVLLPLISGKTTYFVSEGIPTWLGGTTGMDFQTAARQLSSYLVEHPTTTLDSMTVGHHEVPIQYTAAGVLVRLIYEHGGSRAVRGLFDCGPSMDEFRRCVANLLDGSWQTVTTAWRSLATAP